MKILSRSLRGSAIAGLLALCTVAAGCANLKPDSGTSEAISEALTPVEPAPVRRRPPAAAKPEPPPLPRFDVEVVNAPAKAFFAGLVAHTADNIVLHPGVDGEISLTLKQVTLPQVLEVTRDVYGYDIRRNAVGYEVMPAAIQTRVFELNYLDFSRSGISTTRVSSGQVSQGSDGNENSLADGNQATISGNGGGDESRATGSRVDTLHSTDFWNALESSLLTLVGSREGRSVVVNPQAGVVVVRAQPHELRDVQDYLETVEGRAKRQVILEAKIVEVDLADGLQLGINWAAVGVTDEGYTLAGAQLSAAGLSAFELPEVIGSQTLSPGNPVTRFDTDTQGGSFVAALDIGEFQAFIELLGTQGETRVLSSPRVATLNNQKAVIKAGTDEFFVTDISSNTVTGTASSTNRDVTLTPFFSGIALDVTPQIADDGEVILHVHPTVSEVRDQTKQITVSGETDALPLAVSDIRESDSVVRARSGQIIVIGGLMRNANRSESRATPVLGQLPGVGNLFKSQREVARQTELVILLKPIVVDDDGRVWRDQVNAARMRVERAAGEKP